MKWKKGKESPKIEILQYQLQKYTLKTLSYCQHFRVPVNYVFCVCVCACVQEVWLTMESRPQCVTDQTAWTASSRRPTSTRKSCRYSTEDSKMSVGEPRQRETKRCVWICHVCVCGRPLAWCSTCVFHFRRSVPAARWTRRLLKTSTPSFSLREVSRSPPVLILLSLLLSHVSSSH